MKVAILAGGFGLRMRDETRRRPKALVEIGGRPIIWHIMKHYARHGLADFVIALGYKGRMIRSYFEGDPSRPSTVDPDWRIELVDTGLDTESGGRLKRLIPYLSSQTFMLTYCDALCAVDLRELLTFHRSHGKLATLTAVHPKPRFGQLDLSGCRVVRFAEKPVMPDQWINGGFYVLEPGALEGIDGDRTSWEKGPLTQLAAEGQLMAYRHDGFWQCMDTPHERRLLEQLWHNAGAQWPE